MKQGLFILFLLHSSLLFSQNYHPLVTTGKVWSTAHSYGQPFPYISDYVKFEGDVILGGQTYKQVWRSTDTILSPWTSNGYIRENDQKQVFYLSWTGGAPNNLIYNFAANAGDTIYLFSDPMGFWFKVDSVASFPFLTGETRKMINLSCFSINSFIGHDTWIEGMGSLSGVLGSGS